MKNRKENSLVSVVMPTYNCGKYIAQSVDSVITQTYSNWEIRIVDDCSSDNTKEILKPYLEKYSEKIFYTRFSHHNKGAAQARTEGIRQSRGKYIAFLDSDDLWLPEKLEKQVDFMEKTGALFSCTGYARMDESGEDLNVDLFPPEKTDYKKCLRLSDPIGNLTVMYDQEVLGKFSVPDIKKGNDFALILQILKKTNYCYGMKDVLARYRFARSGSVSGNRFVKAKYLWQLYRNIEQMSFFKSCGAICCWAWVKGTGIGLNIRRGYDKHAS